MSEEYTRVIVISDGVGWSGAIGRVDDGGWSEFDASALDGDVPALQVYLLVVRGAQEAAFPTFVSPPFNPVPHVVRGTDSRWSIAAR